MPDVTIASTAATKENKQCMPLYFLKYRENAALQVKDNKGDCQFHGLVSTSQCDNMGVGPTSENQLMMQILSLASPT
eukprot:11114752-Ditylum_brightwellii.AAC.1